MVGPDGTIYALRPENTLYALKDDGVKLTELWSVKIDDKVQTPPAVGPDNSVYYTSQTTLFRAEGKTGKILDSVEIHTPSMKQGQFAIDKKHKIYFNNGEVLDDGRLYCFTKDLKLQWVDTVKTIYLGGPALASNGMLAVAGDSTNITVYHTADNTINQNIHKQSKKLPIAIKRNCLEVTLQKESSVALKVYTIAGREVYGESLKKYNKGKVLFTPQNLQRGYYLYNLVVNGKSFRGRFLWW